MAQDQAGHTETPQRLIDVASRMFAETSVDAVSIRSITREAHLGPAAVHYHFKTKDALLDAIIERHGRRVIREILSRGRVLMESDAPPTARQIVECIAIPYFDLLARAPREGTEWLRIVAELARAQDERLARGAQEVTSLLRELVKRGFPAIPEEQRVTATAVAVSSLVTLSGQVQALTGHDDWPVPPQVRRLLIDFVAGGLQGSFGDPAEAADVSPWRQSTHSRSVK